MRDDAPTKKPRQSSRKLDDVVREWRPWMLGRSAWHQFVQQILVKFYESLIGRSLRQMDFRR